MNTRFAETLENPSPKKRTQRYTGFTLQPGDEELLELLPSHQRDILRAKGNYNELAASFGVALGTIRSRLHRARAALEALRRSRSVEEPQSSVPGGSPFH